jgi:hypothetical protein
MVPYLLDASVVAEFYKPASGYAPPEYNRVQAILAHLSAQNAEEKATLYMPCFCVCEVKKVLAKWYHEDKLFPTPQIYREAVGKFLDHVHDRKLFYSYDYLRYHSIVADEVIEADLAVPLRTRTDGRPVSARLSSVDTLLIAMGIELYRVHRQPVWLLTNDIRARDVAREFPKKLKVRDWPGLTADRLPL